MFASFKKLRLRLEFDQATAAPEFSVSLGDEKAEVHLEELIGSLDDYCQRQGIRVCLMLDEIQETCGLKRYFATGCSQAGFVFDDGKQIFSRRFWSPFPWTVEIKQPANLVEGVNS